MYNRLDSFLHKHKIFYKYQFGFRKNHATTNALTEVTDYIYKSLDEENYVFGIYIDLKKAFDTVQHDVLLSKIQHYGIRGTAFESDKTKTIRNYKWDSIRHIRVMRIWSPQGSVLGPMFVLLFINDINELLENIIVKLFADDTNYFISGR